MGLIGWKKRRFMWYGILEDFWRDSHGVKRAGRVWEAQVDRKYTYGWNPQGAKFQLNEMNNYLFLRAVHGKKWTMFIGDDLSITVSVQLEDNQFSSVQLSHSVVSDSLWLHGLQHARPPCPPSTPGAYSNSCPLSRWCHPTISPSVIPLSSHFQSFPASQSFPVIGSLHQVAKVLECQHQSFQWLFRTDFL